ncbi:hypothetical protein [Shewanella aestuarii]|uniref:Uncharacterized protein n=1 Tax=Shewanella aestuarii TaxID=1028752 RepID=A0A6G9QNS4_9GAMM|nr:hypothetical protein [Shewanella aestuarii]QIR15489.1 hypothetical protein HBH39_14120 [Shewanella aestuarii]
MNDKLVTSLLAGLLLCTGCGSDSDSAKDEPPVINPPPVVDSIDATEALAINLSLAEFDGVSGTLNFSLADDDALAVTNAKDYSITYFGFPDENLSSSHAKAWKRWHVTHQYTCDSAAADCEGVLVETEKGSYRFDATDLDWDVNTAPGSVKKYKVAIEIKGTLASTEIALLPST